MNRVHRPLLVFALILVLVLALPTLVLAKSFTIDQVNVDGVVASDGSLTLTETRALSFDGDFSRVFWTLSKEGAESIEIISVTDDRATSYTRTDDQSTLESRPEGTYLVVDTGGYVEVHAFHRSENEQRKFELKYRVKGAAQRWADTGELNWQLLGDEAEIPVQRFEGMVRVEGVDKKADVKAWAHGPLTGLVTVADDGTVSLTVDDVPAQTFVEVRMMFPEAALSQAPKSDESRAEQIMAEEAKAADEANAERRGARVQMVLWVGGPWLFSLLALALGIWAFVRFGREHRPEFLGQYFREDPRPDLHPAVVGALWRFGKVEDVDIAATLMDLADKGVISMAPTEVDKNGLAGVFGGRQQTFVLQRVAGMESKATPLDNELMRILFDDVAGGQGQLVLSEIEPYARAHAQSFSASIKAWKDSASATAESMGFFEPDSRTWQIGIFVLAVFVAAMGIFITVQVASGLPLLVPIPVAIVLAVLGIFMNRRSKAGNELHRTYVALRDFLKDFSRLEEAPPASVILWNRFLVLAVVFGVAEQVIEQLRVKMPDLVRDPGFQTSYWWVYAGGYGRSPVSTISQSFTGAMSVAASTMSSSSGGGGGFSGGGGFGGGGGGFGAD